MANKKVTFMVIALALALILLISGTEARGEIYDPMCPGVCDTLVKPDCNRLCHELGFLEGFCKEGKTCCCNKKISGPVDVPATTA